MKGAGEDERARELVYIFNIYYECEPFSCTFVCVFTLNSSGVGSLWLLVIYLQIAGALVKRHATGGVRCFVISWVT